MCEKYKFIAVKGNASVDYHKGHHVSISASGVPKGDIDNLMKYYEITESYLQLNARELLEQVMSDCNYNCKNEAFVYYFETEEIRYDGLEYNESYTPNRKLIANILSLVEKIDPLCI